MRRTRRKKYTEEWDESLMPLVTRYARGERTPQTRKAAALYQRQKRSVVLKKDVQTNTVMGYLKAGFEQFLRVCDQPDR